MARWKAQPGLLDCTGWKLNTDLYRLEVQEVWGERTVVGALMLGYWAAWRLAVCVWWEQWEVAGGHVYRKRS